MPQRLPGPGRIRVHRNGNDDRMLHLAAGPDEDVGEGVRFRDRDVRSLADSVAADGGGNIVELGHGDE